MKKCTIFNRSRRAIGELVDKKVIWFYSDGRYGGERGGHFMSPTEFLKYNNLL